MPGIYILENKVNGKCYVGQTKRNIQYRINAHNRGQYIDNVINKYGLDIFTQHIYTIPEHLLNYFEQELIIKTGSLFPNGYNLEGGGTKGYIYSETVLEKMRISATGNTNRLGKKCPEETKKKMRKLKLGTKASKETKEKLSKMSKGKNNSFYGKEHSEETKIRMSESAKKRIRYPLSEETKRKISEIHKGMKHTKETILKMSALKTGKKASDKTKKKMSEAHKKRYSNPEARKRQSEITTEWWRQRKLKEDNL